MCVELEFSLVNWLNVETIHLYSLMIYVWSLRLKDMMCQPITFCHHKL